jgi:hypothetical protein
VGKLKIDSMDRDDGSPKFIEDGVIQAPEVLLSPVDGQAGGLVDR